MPDFYHRLSYSIGNEDWKTEQRALKIKPTDRILCITASGDRPINLLTSDCKEILAIDANLHQNELLALKIAAMETLDTPDYLGFLGITEHPDRRKLFAKVAEKLTSTSREFWEKRLKEIDKGIIYRGTIEKLTTFVAKMISLIRGSDKVEKLFSFDNIEEQREFVKNEWQTKGWRRALNFCLDPFFGRFFVKDPGLYLALGPGVRPGIHVYDQMGDFLDKHLAKTSILLGLVVKGKIFKEAFPPYLTPQGCDEIRPKLDRIKIKNANVVDYLESAPEKSFDCFSISDVASYLTRPDFERLIKGIYRTARPGARFCIRHFTSSHQIPEEYFDLFKRDTALEQQLDKEDCCFIYRFNVGKIIK